MNTILDTPQSLNGISITGVTNSRLSTIDMDNIPFGRIFSDHMLVADCIDGEWQAPEIVPYGALNFTPAMSALNYGQSIFEGMKAYKRPDGAPVFFRIMDNHKRMNLSATRMCMPQIPESIFINGIKTLIELDRQWLPSGDQGALYVRPLLFATDDYIGVKSSDNYKFVVFTCPVGAYYTTPVNLLATKEFVRASVGGTGAAKAAGNYAAAMMPDKMAKSKGYNNILWLDGKDHQYIEECGTMNVFFVIGDTVLTPRLTGTILQGITRNSVLRLLKDNGYKVEERPISIYEIEAAYNEGMLRDAFGTGTAASIAPINKIGFAGKDMQLPEVADRKVSTWLSDTLNGIKYGQITDPYGWMSEA